MRLLITGYPGTGKTMLAGTGARHTDDVIGLGWSEGSAEVAEWFSEPGPWIIEGVAVPRALRKWLLAHEGRPCDRVVFLTKTYGNLAGGRLAMARGMVTVWNDLEAELSVRGVEVEIR